jgi:protease-4
MKDFLKMFFASLFALVFLVLVLVGVVAMQSAGKPDIKDGSYLVIDLYGQILPYNPPEDIVAEVLGGEPETLQRILPNLEKAAVDDRIEGVIVKISSNVTIGGASMEEIRDAIKDVREAGKKVYAYSDDMNRNGLFVASACDSIFMPLGAEVTLVGFGGTLMYFQGLLDKLDIHPNIHRIAEYKSAAEPVLRKDMSPEAREMYTWMLDDLWEVQIGAIAEDRGFDEDKITDFMEYAMFTAPQAEEAGLIDDIRYWDEIDSLLSDGDDRGLKTVSQSTYAEVERKSLIKGKKKIAVVHAYGMIGGRKSKTDPMFGMLMGHESVAKELRRVGKDDDVEAVVFRVESNGGESLASDLIAHEVKVLSGKKPVVASMIDVAASGGYAISYLADRVLADRMTITGSIGSINGKFNVAGMYNKIGITFDRITKGPNGLLWSEFNDFDEEQRGRVEDNHWEGFSIWMESISEARGIPMDELETLAMGRVWTGRQAVDNRLVDEIGGLARAVAVAKELAEIPADEDVEIVHYPEKRDLLDMIFGGDASKSALRWVMYKFIREDLAESIRLFLDGAPLAVEVE